MAKGAFVSAFGKATPERLSIFSDGVFAVLITVLVLELHAPKEPTLEALLSHWPAWLSYALSFLFIAVVWVNHHYLMRYASEATPRLLWFNFGCLFWMSLLPFSTAWMAETRLAPQPVAFYAAVCFVVNATYICLMWELVETSRAQIEVRKAMRYRSMVTLCLFAVAGITALKYPLLALAICFCCLIAYLRPEPPAGARSASVIKRRGTR